MTVSTLGKMGIPSCGSGLIFQKIQEKLGNKLMLISNFLTAARELLNLNLKNNRANFKWSF